MVMSIFWLTSTRTSGRAYIQAPIMWAMKMAYLTRMNSGPARQRSECHWHEYTRNTSYTCAHRFINPAGHMELCILNLPKAMAIKFSTYQKITVLINVWAGDSFLFQWISSSSCQSYCTHTDHFLREQNACEQGYFVADFLLEEQGHQTFLYVNGKIWNTLNKLDSLLWWSRHP